MIQPERHGDGSLNSVSIYCRNPAPGFHQPLAAGERIFTKGQDSVSETIQRYAGAHAKGYLDHVRSWVGACGPVRDGDRVSVVGEGFVGEGSLLIESTIP